MALLLVKDLLSYISSMEDLVQRKRNDQGHHECEVLGCGMSEVEESAYAWDHCNKNPGHPSFISAPDFSLTHLPPEYRKPYILEYVRSVAARTVKLRVACVSQARPDGFCFSHVRGQSIPHFGSGIVSAVHHVSGLKCPCVECEHSRSVGSQGSPACLTWYKIILHTAQHVVYDTLEARNTQVSLFYDDQDAKSDGRMKTMWGAQALESPDGGDVCTMICATHDRELVRQLELALSKLHRLGENLFLTKPHTTDLRDVCVIVSHPHGQPKQVTVGEGKYRERADSPRGQCYYVYSTDTCPGSSGALVIRLDFDFNMYLFPNMTWGALHSMGGLDGGLNKSGMSSPDFFHL